MNKVSIINEKNLGEIADETTYSDLYELSSILSSESWAPGIFNAAKRTIKNLSNIRLLVLDIDDGCTLESAKETFAAFQHIIATSRSHQKEKNGVVCDRFRVVLFLDSEITNDKDFKATWETASKRWPFIDQACKDSSRFFYPSPEIISVKTHGILYATSIAAPQPVSTKDTEIRVDTETKGDLWKTTYEFLVNGAPAGTRHNRLVSAVGNMREQGYSKPEATEKIEGMILGGGDWTQPNLSAIDLKTIDRMYARDSKYPFRAQDSEKLEKSIIVNASELIDETFAYLSDKDKVKGEPTGIDGLDALLGGGFRTGELTVLMAQAKTGKNTLYHYLIYKHLERGLPFGYASRELNPATEVIPNLLSIALKTNAWQSSLDSTYQKEARQVLSNWSLFFAPGYGHFDFSSMSTWFRTLKDLGVDHFLFDHFHYALQGEDYESTAKLIKELKSITKELDIHLSLIVQPRSLRDGEALSLATLRGGAAIGQALDNLLILERTRDDKSVSRLSLEVARHKLARLGNIFLKYDTDTTEFIEVDKRTVVENDQPPMPKGATNRWFERSIRT